MSTLNPDTTRALTQLADITAGWLTKAGMTTEADAVRDLPPVTDSEGLDAARMVVQPMMQAAYRRAGVVTWPDAQAGIDAARESGALSAALDAAAPYEHTDPMRRRVDGLAGWLHTIACYAAHAAVTA